jgi:outer membrane protein insertion porin family/translocation and assembly module TamA
MFRCFRHLPVLSAAVACLVSVPGIGAQSSRDAKEMERPAVRDLQIKGVKSVDEDQLLEGLATEESSCNSLILTPFCLLWKSPAFYTRRYLDRAEFKRDVLRIKVFYWRHGFREAQVDTSVVRAADDEVNVRFTVREGPPTVITALRVQGVNEILRPRQRRDLMRVRRGRPLDLPALDSTLMKLRGALADRGYANARVTQRTAVDDSARQATVIISVAPGPLVRVGDIEIAGTRKIEARTIRNSLNFKEGDVYRASELAESQRTLYESGLFRAAEIAPLTPSGALAGRNVGRVTGDSAGATTGNSVNNAPMSQTGRAGAETATDTAGLEDGGPPPSLADSIRPVAIMVQEMPPREARVSAGFSTVDFFQVNGRYTHYNWYGQARRLDLQGAVGNILGDQMNGVKPFREVIDPDDPEADRYLAPTWQANADVQQRWFQDPRNTIGVGVFAHRRSSPAIFIDKGYGANATFTRLVAAGLPVSANYRFEITTVEASSVFYCVSFGVCDLGTIAALQEPQRLSPLSLVSTLDRTNNPLGPTSGYRARVEVEHASAFTASDFRYNRAYVEGSYYRPAFGGVLASRVRVGGIRALASTNVATGAELLGDTTGVIIHPRRRFYAGGSQSVRGFGENQLGPRVLTIPENTLRGRDSTAAEGVTYKKCPLSTAIEDCNPNSEALGANGDPIALYSDSDFQPRPLGGNSLIEANLEYRFGIWGPLTGAVFVDGAVVGAADFNAITSGNLSALASGTGAITPGFGIRYLSPVGPVRVDVGINPRLAENLPVVTERAEIVGNDTTQTLVRLKTNRNYNPAAGEGFRGLLRRFTIHLSIGEAF